MIVCSTPNTPSSISPSEFYLTERIDNEMETTQLALYYSRFCFDIPLPTLHLFTDRPLTISECFLIASPFDTEKTLNRRSL